ncbi:MAG: hypothetical protein CENE_02649 [Candidatus Celerinatantimonas neptuna]|nr:MAG: hypothetical protein CENE_02649 [Candidatus Celerinatantimonas neptuna]
MGLVMFEQLSDVFQRVAFKYLSAVDADLSVSHQHEIGGLVNVGFGQLLGMPNDGSRRPFDATMVYLDDNGDDPVIVEDEVTWYDARYKDTNRSPEWRLYYKSNDVSERFRPGDFFLISLVTDGSLLMLFCPGDSEYEIQFRGLFGAREKSANKKGLTRLSLTEHQIAVPIRLIFERYGVEVGQAGDDYLSRLIEQFGPAFPSTREFSVFTREQLASDINPVIDPDAALVEWMETEEKAFRQLEKHIVREKLRKGFGENGDDVDGFVRFSLSVQNRRKSRSGHAFENHIEKILRQNHVQFKRGAVTEGKQKPDFLFPGPEDYKNQNFPQERLRLLGAKTTCKDRWRQVLAEAERIDRKHLITLEPAISKAQTEEMEEHQLQLVVPEAIQPTYQDNQKDWLMSFRNFIDEVKEL